MSWEENDWDYSNSLQIGFRTEVGQIGRQYRIVIQFYDGRSQIGEFFKMEEQHLSFGFIIDI